MELIRRIVLDRHSAGTPIALEVARSFVEIGDSQLPYFLEDHLLGLSEQRSGLFGKNIQRVRQVPTHLPYVLCSFNIAAILMLAILLPEF
jgi:hypothetical protein